MIAREQQNHTTSKIVTQILRPDGIWTEFENGLEILLPYKTDGNGDQYADLFPND